MGRIGLTLFGSYKSVIKKYVEFNGRLSRKGYWYFVIANILVSIIITLAWITFTASYEELSQTSNLNDFDIEYYYSLFILIPSIAASVRRLHDTNRSGWYILLNLIPVIGNIIFLILLLERGGQESNNYGPVPQE